MRDLVGQLLAAPGGGGGGLAVGYRNPQRGQPCRIIPNLANNTGIAPSADAWSAWAQVSAGEAADYIIAAAHYGWISQVNDVMHFQIGIGAAGAEVPIAEWEDGTTISGTGALPVPARTRQLPYVKVAAGTRIAARCYDEVHGAGGAGGVGIYLCLLPAIGLAWDTWDDRYAAGTRSEGGVRAPAVPNYIALAVLNTWVEVVAAASQEQLIVAMQRYPTNSPRASQYDVGIGAAGAEVPMESCADVQVQAVVGTWGNMDLCRPVRVHAGERIAVRQTFGAGAAQVALMLENITS
jgi:hypothetical protein